MPNILCCLDMFSITGFLIACLICHNAYGSPGAQIIGGRDAPPEKYPYQVSLKTSEINTHFCSGAIISKKYVITAAHCLEDKEQSSFNIDVGSNDLYIPRTTYAVKKIIRHPDYNKTQRIHDIGLIQLTEDISFDKNANFIKLISVDNNYDGIKFTFTGWGKNENGRIQERLQEVTVTGYSQTNCTQTYASMSNTFNVSKNHMCTLQAINVGICEGDDGGALTLDGELVGIASFYPPLCASGYPDVFTKVYNYRTWINKYINAGNIQQSNIVLGLLMAYLCVYSFW